MKVGIIGYGKIGREVEKRVFERNWEVKVAVNTSAVYRFPEEGIRIRFDESSNWLKYFKGADVGILCISTLDDGLIAYEYIKALVEMGIPVVTSEKGSFGNYFPELKPKLNKIGYSATVGGGTRMLHWLKERITQGETREIHLIINGTLNFIFDGLNSGRSLEEMTKEAKTLGYTEPGTQDPLQVINTESCKDVPMKVSVLLNTCGFGEVRAREIDVLPISETDLKKLSRETAFRRYIVSITREENEDDMVGGFKFKIGEWYISAGFKNRTQNPLFLHLVPPGVNNAALVCGTDGKYILTGPGAGDAPTAGAIMKDIENLLEIKE